MTKVKMKMKMKMKIWRTERLIVIRCHALYGAASKCIIISKRPSGIGIPCCAI